MLGPVYDKTNTHIMLAAAAVTLVCMSQWLTWNHIQLLSTV